MSDFRQYAPATERNRQPILDVLQAVLPQTGSVLEIASGTGEHITFFSAQISRLYWIASEPKAEGRKSIQAWAEKLACDNLYLPPLDLEVSQSRWPVEANDFSLAEPITAIVNINMIHISPWQMCECLMAGAQRLLPAGGVLYLYGPFKRDGGHTAPSNEAFDRMLRDRDSTWGIRDLEAVEAVANKHGLHQMRVIDMPANNFSVIFTCQ